MESNYWSGRSGSRLTRRRLLERASVAGTGVVGLTIVGCGDDDNDASRETSVPGSTGASASPSSAASTPLKGGTLRVVINNNLTSLDPAYSTSAFDPIAYRTVFDALFEYDPAGKILPALAESSEISADGLTWNLHLQKNVKFHDGTPFNASAAKYNLERVINPANKSPQAAELAQIASIAVPDDYILQIKLKAPYSSLPYVLAGRSGMIFSPAAVEKFGANTRTNPVGTGPFKLAEFLSDSHFVANRNPEYWRPNMPYLDSIRIAINTDSTARSSLLRSGDAELLQSIDNITAGEMEKDSNLQVLTGRTDPVGMTLNMNRKDKPSPLSDIRLRQAVAYAIDSEGIVKVALGGRGKVAPPQNFWFEGHWAYFNDQYTIKRDVQKSKQLLSAAGQPDGFTFNQMLIGKTTTLHDVIQASLAEANIKVNFEQLEVGIFADRNRKGEWDAGGSAGGVFGVDPGPALRRYYQGDSGCVPGGPGAFASSGFSNCEFDQLMAKAELETESGDRKVHYQKMNALWAEPWHSPKLYLSPTQTAARKNVRGVQFLSDWLTFEKAWLAKA